MTNEEVMKKLSERLDAGPTIGNGVYIAPTAYVIGEVILGNDVSIWPACVVRGDTNNIIIGDGTNVQDGSILHISRRNNLTIGKNVTIGHAVHLHGCAINDNVLVGSGSIVLDETVIEEHCIIAAGSLIPPRKIIPAGSMVMGSPAKVVRQLTKEDFDWIHTNAQRYVEYKNVYLEKGF